MNSYDIKWTDAKKDSIIAGELVVVCPKCGRKGLQSTVLMNRPPSKKTIFYVNHAGQINSQGSLENIDKCLIEGEGYRITLPMYSKETSVPS